MDLQTVFYLVGIIYMTFATILLIAMVIVVFYIKKKITDIHDQVNEKIHTFTTKPADVALEVGAAVATSAVKKMKDIINKH